MRVKLNGRLIKTPHTWDIERYRITKADRAATGDMIMDHIARKRKFLLDYEVMSGEEFDYILDILDSDEVFVKLEYENNGRWEEAIVYCGPIKARKARSDQGWYWKNVTFNLIER